MIEVEFDITIDNTGAHDAPLLDEYELAIMLQHTKAQLIQHVQQCLGGLHCEEHGEEAKVCIYGTYSKDTEQLDISYHVDTCCKPFLRQAVTALNRDPLPPRDRY